jgi:hypothetical protein
LLFQIKIVGVQDLKPKFKATCQILSNNDGCRKLS